MFGFKLRIIYVVWALKWLYIQYTASLYPPPPPSVYIYLLYLNCSTTQYFKKCWVETTQKQGLFGCEQNDWGVLQHSSLTGFFQQPP